jgi:hypothetical protein
MPLSKIDYSKTIIYKIVCNDLSVTDTYTGHTTNITKRTNNHKSACNNETSAKHNLKIYQTIRANGGWENFSLIQIEEFPCKNSCEAGARERYQYEIINSNMNSNVPNRSQKQWYIDNLEAISLYRKQYQIVNINTIKQNYLCDCGRNIQHCEKGRHLKTKIHLKFMNLIPEN